jgi:hypothetical protein
VLSYLRASGGSVKDLGPGVVRGTKTTRYGGTIDIARAAGRIAGSGGAQLKSSLEKLTSEGGSAKLPVEVWVDEKNLVRRMTLTMDEAPAGHHFKVALTLELFNFGATPTVNVPGESEVFDATKTSLAGLSAGG